jgi:hypothetical protein
MTNPFLEIQTQINDLHRRMEPLETWEGAASLAGGGGALERTLRVAASDSTAAGIAGADYACDGTDDEAEINSAISVATASGFRGIRLLEGTFEVNGSAAVSVSSSNLIIDGQGDGTVLNIGTGTSSAINVNNQSNITFANMRITGGGSALNRIFRIYGGSNSITFFNVTFDGLTCTLGTGYVIRLENSWSNVTIQNCRFIDNTSAVDSCIGNWASGGQVATGLVIANSHFNCASSAIDLTGQAGAALPSDPADLGLRNIVVSNCHFNGANTEGANSGTFVSVEYADGVTVEGNTIRDATTGVYLRDVFNATVDGNDIRDVTNTGIQGTNAFGAEDYGGVRFLTISNNAIAISAGNLIAVTGPSDGTAGTPSRTNEDYRAFTVIEGNVCYQSTSEGVTLQLASHAVISNNVIVGDYESATPTGIPAGVYIDDCWDILVEGNTMAYWDVGLQVSESSSADPQAYDTLIRGNYIAYNAEQGVSVHGIREYVIDDNYFIGNGSKTNATYSHVEVDRESPSGSHSENLSITRNKFHEGYAANKAQYCVNLGLAGKELTASGILIAENDFRNGAVTAAINSILTTPPEVYDNWTDGGWQAKLGTGVYTALTISGGAISAVEQSDFIKLQPESGNTDDLDTITANAWDRGRMLVLAVQDAADTITAKDATGNLNLAGGDFVLDSRRDRLFLHYDEDLSEWCEISRSNNA